MNDTFELCREISEGADIGKTVLSRLIKRCKDASLRSVMADMFAAYHRIFTEAEELLDGRCKGCCGASKKQKKPIMVGLMLNTAVDATPSHLAEMLIQGCAMSLINISRAQNEFVRCDDEAKQLCTRALKNEQESIMNLLKFV